MEKFSVTWDDGSIEQCVYPTAVKDIYKYMWDKDVFGFEIMKSSCRYYILVKGKNVRYMTECRRLRDARIQRWEEMIRKALSLDFR